MFSSPVSHLVQHALLAYGRSDVSLQRRLAENKKLLVLETELLKLHEHDPANAKVNSLLQRIRAMRGRLKS